MSPAAPVTDPRSQSARSTRVRLAIAAGVLVVGATAAAFCAHPIARWYIVEQASRQGARLVFDDLSLSPTTITLHNARVSLVKVPHVVAEAPRVELSILGLSLSSIHVASARVGADGPVVETLRNLAAWRSAPGDSASIQVDNVSFSWVSAGSPWLTAQASLKSNVDTTSLHITELKSASMTLRQAHVVSDRGKPVILSAGAADPNAAPLKIYLTNAPDLSSLKLTLPPTPGSAFSKAIGVELPGKDPVLEGEIALKDADGPAPVSSVRAILKGYVPPHPREIDGLVNGGQTTLAATLHLDRNTNEIAIDDTTIGVGSLVFKGKGRIEGKGTYALLHSALHGSIPCSSLVQGAASSYGPLGEFVGGIAAGAVQGSVSVTLHIEADSRKLSAAKIGTSVGVGCGLKGFGSD